MLCSSQEWAELLEHNGALQKYLPIRVWINGVVLSELGRGMNSMCACPCAGGKCNDLKCSKCNYAAISLHHVPTLHGLCHTRTILGSALFFLSVKNVVII